MDTGGHLWVGDTADLALVLGREPSAAARHALETGGAVALYPQYVHDGRFTIDWWSDEQLAKTEWGRIPGVPLRTETLPAVVDLPAHPIFSGVFVSRATAERIGLHYEDSVILTSTRTAPTTAQTDALTRAVWNLPGNGGRFGADVETGPASFAAPWVWGLLGLSTLIAIAASAVAIGLARFDGRQDDATLSSVGAGHRVRRAFAFWQALVIAGTGAVLGAAMGIVPALALGANTADVPFAPPWLQIGLTALAVPLLIACGSWLSTTRGRTAARRTTIA
jgi:hypothetical protein